MSTPDINLNLLFDTRKLRKAVDDLLADPGLSEEEKIKLELETQTGLARHNAISTIFQPLTEAYYKDRRRKDRSYDPEKDTTFKYTHELVHGVLDRLWSEIEPRHELRKRIWAANHARHYIGQYFLEFLKVYDLAFPAKEPQRRKHE
ncbi:hypothetical protein [Caballeronia sp. HLA56]